MRVPALSVPRQAPMAVQEALTTSPKSPTRLQTRPIAEVAVEALASAHAPAASAAEESIATVPAKTWASVLKTDTPNPNIKQAHAADRKEAHPWSAHHCNDPAARHMPHGPRPGQPGALHAPCRAPAGPNHAFHSDKRAAEQCSSALKAHQRAPLHVPPAPHPGQGAPAQPQKGKWRQLGKKQATHVNPVSAHQVHPTEDGDKPPEQDAKNEDFVVQATLEPQPSTECTPCSSILAQHAAVTQVYPEPQPTPECNPFSAAAQQAAAAQGAPAMLAAPAPASSLRVELPLGMSAAQTQDAATMVQKLMHATPAAKAQYATPALTQAAETTGQERPTELATVDAAEDNAEGDISRSALTAAGAGDMAQWDAAEEPPARPRAELESIAAETARALLDAKAAKAGSSTHAKPHAGVQQQQQALAPAGPRMQQLRAAAGGNAGQQRARGPPPGFDAAQPAVPPAEPPSALAQASAGPEVASPPPPLPTSPADPRERSICAAGGAKLAKMSRFGQQHLAYRNAAHGDHRALAVVVGARKAAGGGGMEEPQLSPPLPGTVHTQRARPQRSNSLRRQLLLAPRPSSQPVGPTDMQALMQLLQSLGVQASIAYGPVDGGQS